MDGKFPVVRRESRMPEVRGLRLEERWAIIDLQGKGGHIRTMPVPSWINENIDAWMAAGRIERGRLFRCVCRAGMPWGDGISGRLACGEAVRHQDGSTKAGTS